MGDVIPFKPKHVEIDYCPQCEALASVKRELLSGRDAATKKRYVICPTCLYTRELPNARD